METIKNYLESMFMSLPMTSDVLKAKKELLQMMQDKYEELIREGKRENEAVSIVISEFGDLKEIADDLGIGSFLNSVTTTKKQIPQDEAYSFLKSRAQAAFKIALGVALFILSPVGFILEEETHKLFVSGSEAFGIIFLFACVAIGVGLLVYTGTSSAKFEYLFNGESAISLSAAEEIEKERISFLNIKNLYTTIGISVLILGVGTTAVIAEYSHSDVSGACFLAFVALGVALIIFANVKYAGYRRILSVNDTQMYTNEVKRGSGKRTYVGNNKFLTIYFSTYWQTVTCLYLIISFLTGAWHMTWIIWVIAPLINMIISSIYSDDLK